MTNLIFCTTCACETIFCKEVFYNEFYENPADSVISDTRSQMDSWMDVYV